MGKPSFKKFAVMLDQAVDRIPSHFLRNLTGGFNLQEEAKQEGEYYIMGEYIEDGMGGCFIMFYYGSFVQVLEGESEHCWKAEIVDTVLHELQHHLESMAGQDDLASKEAEEFAKLIQKME